MIVPEREIVDLLLREGIDPVEDGTISVVHGRVHEAKAWVVAVVGPQTFEEVGDGLDQESSPARIVLEQLVDRIALDPVVGSNLNDGGVRIPDELGDPEGGVHADEDLTMSSYNQFCLPCDRIKWLLSGGAVKITPGFVALDSSPLDR